MPNNDRVSERYYGQINSEDSHEATRSRIHWICAQASGSRVLDVGCSQGIASILLAREGFSVTGIDLDAASLRFARAERARESKPVRDHVAFQLASILDFTAGEHRFDTVILGEILEHFAHPGRLIARASGLLARGGKLIVTVPYGYHPYHDHKQTFYAGSLSRLLYPEFRECALEVRHKYLCYAGAKRGRPASPPAPGADRLRRWMELDEAEFLRIEQEQQRRMNQRKAALDRAAARLKQLEERDE
ncbi:class I SAM-dependent methyltransferase [Paenibacillus glufosinatiresistens]|uniref:class I SAM-dependent methyltransferase n=1 Tax=Paenibacillus glufosinatiresistens TaxID=3070657 RepID=UPI00286E9B37|nr:methyltransferase domain-containing protein [Paenibacillus sp. YX.27]